MKNRMLSFGVLVAGEVERFILWEDRLSANNTLGRVMATDKDYEYVFILLNGSVFADTFSDGVPSDLLSYGTDYPQQAYYWEFMDNAGDLYYDYVIPVMSANAVLRMGVKLSSIDHHLFPAVSAIILIGILAFIIGILLSWKIAVSSTKEVTLLSDTISSYNIDNNPDGLSDISRYHSIVFIPELVESFQKMVLERKSAEENLKQSLYEKENLLKEVFHRTRNNMQIISSLLYLQAEKYSDSNVDNIVEKTNNRIQMMSLVHQMLNETNNAMSIDLDDLATSVLSFLIQKYDSSKKINYIIAIKNVALSFDAAIQMGLILNELVSNSLLYAFQEKDQGTVSIESHRLEDNTIFFRYSDNGAGFSGDIGSDADSNYWGLRLVISMVKGQLNGKIKIENNNGFNCYINFNDSKLYNRRGV